MKRRRPAARDPRATKARLIRAAAALFAARGYHATTARDVAARAGTNVAAANYHFGSKRGLYLAVVRERFAALASELEAAGVRPDAAALARLSRPALERLLRTRIEILLDFLLGRGADLHARLMMREMLDPSGALPTIVDELLRPIMVREMGAIVRQLAPALSAQALLRVVASISGQALFYRATMPASLRIFGRRAWSPAFRRVLAAHIAEFSLGGITRVAAAGAAGGRHAR